MPGTAFRRGFSLFDLLVVVGIAVVALVLVYVGVLALWNGDRHPRPSRVRMEIQHLMTALTAYHDEFDAYPSGGIDLNGDGDLDDPGENRGAGRKDASPADASQLQLRAVTVRLPKDGGKSYTGPYYLTREDRVNADGQLTDRFGHPYRYLADGRPTGRVGRRQPLIWSVAEDGRQDKRNNNLDDDGDGRVDEIDEVENDICSWFD